MLHNISLYIHDNLLSSNAHDNVVSLLSLVDWYISFWPRYALSPDILLEAMYPLVLYPCPTLKIYTIQEFLNIPVVIAYVCFYQS